jgi:hypothetical protein
MPVVIDGTTGITSPNVTTAGTNDAAIQLEGGVSMPRMVLSTAQNTTSGTAIDFSSIPNWVKRITVIFNGVSTSGISNIQVQIGSGSITTSGYSGTCSQAGGNTVMSAAFVVNSNVQAANTHSGIITICLISGNTYVEAGTLNANTATNGCFSGGTVSLSGTLDRLRLTTAGGTDTFDAGSVNILYEG